MCSIGGVSNSQAMQALPDMRHTCIAYHVLLVVDCIKCRVDVQVRGGGGGRGLASYVAAIEQQRQGGIHLQAVADQLVRVADLLAAYR